MEVNITDALLIAHVQQCTRMMELGLAGAPQVGQDREEYGGFGGDMVDRQGRQSRCPQGKRKAGGDPGNAVKAQEHCPHFFAPEREGGRWSHMLKGVSL